MRKVLYILGQLSDDDAEWLATVGRRQSIAKGAALVVEGKPVDSLYFILDGRFEVSALAAGQLAIVTCGEIIGEISLIDERPPAASVTAMDDAMVLAIKREELKGKLAADMQFAAHFYRALATFLAERMRSTVLRMGHGRNEQTEPDIDMLDSADLAEARVERILKRFQGSLIA